jgi:hypothetical protein
MSFRRRSVSFAVALLPVACAAGAALGQSAPSVPVIHRVEIDRGAVFDSAEARRFWGFRLVNALHAETRPYVIRRELLFAPGQLYDSARVHESERNLRALGVFQDVAIDTMRSDSGLVVRVRTTDGWTTNLGFGIRTSGSEVVINAFVQELNLLGTRTIATLGYENDPDRSTVLVGFDTPRLIASRVGIGASYSQRSDGHAAGASIRYPFLSLSSREGAILGWSLFDGRVLHYERGFLADSARRKAAVLRGDGAFALRASPRGYVHLGMVAQLRRDDFGEEGGTEEIPRTITLSAGPYVALRKPHYIQVQNFQAMSRVEDVDLGPTIRVDLAAAPAAWGYERNGVGGRIAASAGVRVPRGFLQFGGSLGGLQSSAGTDSSSMEAHVLAVVQPSSAHLFAANVAGGQLKNPPFGNEYDIGLGFGVRAFPSHAYTGDRYYLTNAEYRWLVIPRFLGLVGIGVAGFVDHGGAWFAGDERRTGTDAGFGLRIGSIRSAASAVGRLDVAYRFESDRESAGWVISLGRGFGWQRF